MPRMRLGKWLGRMAVVAASLARGLTAFAQSCPLCYRAAVAGKAGVIHALRSGILVLLVPLLLILGAIVLVAFRRRDQFNDAALEAGIAPENPMALGVDWLESGSVEEKEDGLHANLR